MASRPHKGQSDIVAGLGVSSAAARCVHRMIRHRARTAGVTEREYLAGVLDGRFPHLKPADIEAASLRAASEHDTKRKTMTRRKFNSPEAS